MPFVSSLGRDIYYECHGEGPALLFLHGAGSNAATWWQQLPAFRAQHTCITMDIRCFGRSRAPTSEFSLPNFVADALAVLDAAGVAQAVVVGQSLGGMIGLRLALQHPERVRALVACDSSLAIDLPELMDSVARRFERVSAVSIEQRSLGTWFLVEQPALAALYAQINHFNPSAWGIPAEEWRQAMLRLNQPEALLPFHQVAQVRCPLLLLVGEADPIVPVSAMQSLAQLRPGTELCVVPRAAHSAYFEQPAVFNREVQGFLARLPSGQGQPRHEVAG